MGVEISETLVDASCLFVNHRAYTPHLHFHDHHHERAYSDHDSTRHDMPGAQIRTLSRLWALPLPQRPVPFCVFERPRAGTLRRSVEVFKCPKQRPAALPRPVLVLVYHHADIYDRLPGLSSAPSAPRRRAPPTAPPPARSRSPASPVRRLPLPLLSRPRLPALSTRSRALPFLRSRSSFRPSRCVFLDNGRVDGEAQKRDEDRDGAEVVGDASGLGWSTEEDAGQLWQGVQPLTLLVVFPLALEPFILVALGYQLARASRIEGSIGTQTLGQHRDGRKQSCLEPRADPSLRPASTSPRSPCPLPPPPQQPLRPLPPRPPSRRSPRRRPCSPSPSRPLTPRQRPRSSAKLSLLTRQCRLWRCVQC